MVGFILQFHVSRDYHIAKKRTFTKKPRFWSHSILRNCLKRPQGFPEESFATETTGCETLFESNDEENPWGLAGRIYFLDAFV